MARYKNPYSYYTRKLPSGKTVFYYYTYDKDGKRSKDRSTGIGFTRKRDEAKARKEVEDYLPEDLSVIEQAQSKLLE